MPSPPKRAFHAATSSSSILRNRTSGGVTGVTGTNARSNSAAGRSGHFRCSSPRPNARRIVAAVSGMNGADIWANRTQRLSPVRTPTAAAPTSLDRRPWRGALQIFVAEHPYGAGFGCGLAEFHVSWSCVTSFRRLSSSSASASSALPIEPPVGTTDSNRAAQKRVMRLTKLPSTFARSAFTPV